MVEVLTVKRANCHPIRFYTFMIYMISYILFGSDVIFFSVSEHQL